MPSSTGIGSLPGKDIVEAIKVVTDEFTELMHLPELPQRGPGADMIGRTAALLSGVATDLAIETTPTGWKFSDAPGAQVRRALSWLHEDLDRIEERVGTAQVRLKVQLTGPITLASSIALPRGERAIVDPGAVRDIALAHREVTRMHIADVCRRIPNAALIVQIDEPAMDGALRGTIPTQSGFGRLRALERPAVVDLHRALARTIADAGATSWLHSCAPNWPLALVRGAGYRGISGDFTLLTDSDEDELGAAIESGIEIVAGVIPTRTELLTARPSSEAATVLPVRLRYQRLGLSDRLASVVITPTCGLGNVTWKSALIAISRTKEAARTLVEED